MDAREKEARRMIAAELFEQGELRDSQIASLLEVTARAVSKWHKVFREGGRETLRSSGPPGAPGLLDVRQCLELRRLLRRGAKAYGFATGFWTLKRIRRVIAERFGITYTTLSGCGGCCGESGTPRSARPAWRSNARRARSSSGWSRPGRRS